MDPIQVKLFVDALTKGNTKKASELLEKCTVKTDFDAGYKRALSGIAASVENQEVNSLFVKMISGALPKKHMEEHRMKSKKISAESFRPAAERGYEKAWYDVLSIFLGKKKVGLDKHVEGELY
jgi:hypothetical protein